MKKRLLSMLLAAAMLVSMLPVAVFADDEPIDEPIFDACNGEILHGDYDEDAYDGEGGYALPKNPEWKPEYGDSYDFDGWYEQEIGDRDLNDDDGFVHADDAIYYAHWKLVDRLVLTAPLAINNSELTIGGEKLSDLGLSRDKLSDDYGITYDGDKTLTLNKAIIDVAKGEAAVSADCDLSIELKENASLIHHGDGTGDVYGIKTTGELTITGDTDVPLTVVVGSTTGDSKGSYAVHCSEFELARGTTLTVTSGSGSASYGVYSTGVFTNNGTLTATGGNGSDSYGVYSGGAFTNKSTLTATGGSGSKSYGVYSTGAFTNNGTLEVTGGTVGENGISCGVFAKDSFTNSNACTLTATGGSATGSGSMSYGVYSTGAFTNNGTLTATGGSAAGGAAESCGVRAAAASENSGTLTATGGSAAGMMSMSYGLYCVNAFTNTGTATVTAGSGETACGLQSNSGEVSSASSIIYCYGSANVNALASGTTIGGAGEQSGTVYPQAVSSAPIIITGKYLFDKCDGTGMQALDSAPGDPTRSGYTFAGWWTSPISGNKMPETPEKATRYYAHWTKDSRPVLTEGIKIDSEGVISVGGKEVVKDPVLDWNLQNAFGVVYDKDAAKLTLTNAVIDVGSGVETGGVRAALCCVNTKLTIELVGESLVRVGDSADSSTAGILSKVNGSASQGQYQLTLTGSGTLTAEAGDAAGEYSSGVFVSDTLENNATLTAVSGDATNSYGVRAGKALINSGTLTAVSGSVTGVNSASYGMFSTGSFTNATAGTITATGGATENGASCGVRVSHSLENNGKLTATGGEATGTGVSIGLRCDQAATNVGTIVATGGNADETNGASRGVNVNKNIVNSGLIVGRTGTGKLEVGNERCAVAAAEGGAAYGITVNAPGVIVAYGGSISTYFVDNKGKESCGTLTADSASGFDKANTRYNAQAVDADKTGGKFTSGKTACLAQKADGSPIILASGAIFDPCNGEDVMLGTEAPATDPTRGDYVFAGWYDAELGGNKAESDFAVGATYYAHWKTANDAPFVLDKGITVKANGVYFCGSDTVATVPELAAYGIAYDKDNQKLALNNVTIDTPDGVNWNTYYAALKSEVALTIDVTGDSVIRLGDGEGRRYGIYIDNGQALTVSGSGSLTATAGDSSDSSPAASYGVYAAGNFDNKATLTAMGGAASSTSGQYARSFGVACNGLFTNSGTLTATGGAAINTSGEAKSCGVSALSGALTNSGTLIATGGTANSTGSANSYGVSGANAVTNSGTLTATAGDAANTWAVYATQTITINSPNGALTAYGKIECYLSSITAAAVAGANETFDSGTTKSLTPKTAGTPIIITSSSIFDLGNGKISLTPDTPTWGSYVFDGWYDAKTGGTLVHDGTAFQTPYTEFTVGKTYYAHWKNAAGKLVLTEGVVIKEDGLYIGVTQKSSGTKTDLSAYGLTFAAAVADPATPAKLTMTNAAIDTPDGVNWNTSSFAALKSEVALTIELVGDNTIRLGDGADYRFGINTDADLTVTGGGSLNVVSGESSNQKSYGVKCNKLTNSSTLTVTADWSKLESFGVYYGNNGLENSGSLTVTASGTGESGYSFAVCGSGDLNNSGTFTATSGDAYGSRGVSCGSITNSGTITVTAGVGTNERCGLNCSSTGLTVTGGSITSDGDIKTNAAPNITAANAVVTGANETFVSGTTKSLTQSGSDPIVIRFVPMFDPCNGVTILMSKTVPGTYTKGSSKWGSYTFDGWYDAKTGGTELTETPVDGVTYYAHWKNAAGKLVLTEGVAVKENGVYIGGSAPAATADELAKYGLTFAAATTDPVAPATLTMTNASIESGDGIRAGTFSVNEKDAYAGIYSNLAIELKLTGENKISIARNDMDTAPCGGCFSNSLTVTGSGTLTFDASNAKGYVVTGLHVKNTLTNSATLIGKAGEATTLANGVAFRGLTNTAGTLTGYAGSGRETNGLNNNSKDWDVTITGGKVVGYGGTGGTEYYGLWTSGNINVSGTGVLELHGGTKADSGLKEAMYLENSGKTITITDNGRIIADSTVKNKGSYADFYTVTGANIDVATGTLTKAEGAENIEIFAKNYTVKFNANGGTPAPGTQTTTALVTKPDTMTKDGYVFIGWYKDPAFAQAWDFTNNYARENLTLYANWVKTDELVTVSGTVEDETGTPVQEAHVYLKRGDTTVTDCKTASDGTFSLSNVAAGEYQLVVGKDDNITTLLVTVAGDSVSVDTVTLYTTSKTSSAVEVMGNDTPDIMVGGLAAVAYDHKNGSDVMVTLEVESKTAENVNAEDKAKIETAAGSGQTLKFIDMTLLLSINGTPQSNIPDTGAGKLLEVLIPYNMSGKSNIALYRQHGTDAEAVKLPEGEENKTADGEYVIIDKVSNAIRARLRYFSTYAIAYAEAPVYSGDDTYAVTLNAVEHGTVTADKKYASAGSTVTITVTPDEGYAFETVTVLDANGKALTLTDLGDGKYSFKMPGGKVTVKATLKAKAETPFFVDVPEGKYYYNAVKWAVENGITKGTDKTHFSPNAPITRAEVVTFLWRAAGSPEPTGTAAKFTDVRHGSYYEKAVAWAIEQGITKGTSKTTFTPGRDCKRCEVVTFLARFAGVKDTKTASKFTDVQASRYYAAAVKWAVDNGVTKGTSKTTFSPNALCKRAEAITFLYRWMVK